jgi:hypothetical protein
MISQSKNLARFYQFFHTQGTERLNGLDKSYFIELMPSEIEEAWQYLKSNFTVSTERINGLFILNKVRAAHLFKEAIEAPIEVLPFPEAQEELEKARLLMLRYIYAVEPGRQYIDAMCKFSQSEFEHVRGQFAQTVPTSETTPETVDALKRMIFTETETMPLTSAISKFMAIHGIEFSMDDPVYRSVFRALLSENPDDKSIAIERLEKTGNATYI